MRVRIAAVFVVISSLLASAAGAAAVDRFCHPSAGNQYVTTTDKYLYVVWSVPKDLSTFAGIKSSAELESFIARTAVFLCHEQRNVEPTGSKPCKVQVVRMNSNDEYTKSAAGGFKTIAELILARERASDDGLKAALALPPAELKALFTSFSVKHDRIQLPNNG
jgi:hypothetical protein